MNSSTQPPDAPAQALVFVSPGGDYVPGMSARPHYVPGMSARPHAAEGADGTRRWARRPCLAIRTALDVHGTLDWRKEDQGRRDQPSPLSCSEKVVGVALWPKVHDFGVARTLYHARRHCAARAASAVDDDRCFFRPEHTESLPNLT